MFVFGTSLLFSYSVHVASGIVDISNSKDHGNRNLNIALLNPTFTSAAYNHKFYIFYAKHFPELTHGKNVTTDLDLLTSKVPNNTAHTPLNLLFRSFPFANHIKQILPNSNVSIINDTDVNNGKIFNKHDKSNQTNAFNIIMMVHEEYVTQQEYDNLKTFVKNGGVLIALSGDVFYAEVKYDPKSDSITLVKGHGLEFNGHQVSYSVAERWGNETTQWLGSIFYHFSFNGYFIQFYNNPFNYSRVEEQTVTNPHDNIILNYNSSDTRYPIAAYYLDYGKGMVIATGLASEVLVKKKAYLNFIDDLVLNCAIKPTGCKELSSKYLHYKSPYNNTTNAPIINKAGLHFIPWGGNSNKFTIKSIFNFTDSNAPIYRIQGNSGNKTVGFTSPEITLNQKNISFTVGNVLKYGNFSHKSGEFRVLFDFKIKGLHNDYNLIFVHGRPVLKEGWNNNNAYYQNIESHQTKFINLNNLIASKNDHYVAITKISITIEPYMVLNPFEFAFR